MHDAPISPKTTEPGHRDFRAALVSVLKSPRRWVQIILVLALLGAAVALIAMFGGWIGRQIPVFEEWIPRCPGHPQILAIYKPWQYAGA